jgi:outer membrane protein assembly factor BamB
VTASSWDQYRGNARRTAAAPWRSAVQPEILWRLDLGPMVDASPVVGPDGTIYVAGAKTPVWPTDQLVAVDPGGAIRWQTILDGYQLRATPVVRRDGSIVAVGHSIYAERVDRDAAGNVASVRWKREARVFLVGADGTVRARTDRNEFFDGPGLSSPAYDGADGVYHWHLYPLAGGDLRRFDPGLTMTSLGGLSVTIGGSSPLSPWEVALCTAATPTLLGAVLCWECSVESEATLCEFEPPDVELPPDPARPPVGPLTPSVSLTPCSDAIAPAYESARFWLAGGKQWQKDVHAISTAAVSAAGRAYLPVRGPDEGRIEGRDQDGERRLLYRLPPGVVPIGPPALGRGTKDPGDTSVIVCRRSDSDRDHRRPIRDARADSIYVTGSDGNLYAIDYKGRLRWTAEGYGLTSPPVVLTLPDGRDVVVAGGIHPPGDVAVAAFRGEDGQGIWNIPLRVMAVPSSGTPILGSPAVHGGRIYVATQRELYAIGYRRRFPGTGRPPG